MKYSIKSLAVGLSVASLINLGSIASADAQQTTDANQPAKPSSKTAAAKAAAQASKEMAAEVQALREEVDTLKRRLDAQNAATQQTQATADRAAVQAASATALATTANTATQAIPAEVHNEVQTAVEAAKPDTDKIHYKGITLTLGGYGALESVYRSKNETSDMASTFSGVPFANSSVGQTSEFRFSARQSRFTALAEGDVSPSTHLSLYGEMDFLGAAQTANSNESNSYTPRMRVFYNTVDWNDLGLHLLAGQNWSLTTLQGKGITPRNEDIPLTIDAQYVVGFTWARQPQLRLTESFNDAFSAAISVENPQTTFYSSATAYPKTVILTDNSAAGTGFNSTNTLSLNHIPDAVAKLAFDPAVGDRTMHFEVYGLYRSFYERLDYENKDVSGGGVGAGLIVPVIPKWLDLQASGISGKGLGRYGSASLPDVTFDGGGNIRPISEIQVLAGLTLHATSQLDFYTYAGEEKESAQPYDLTSATGAISAYGYGNPLYSNSGCEGETATGSCVGNTRLVAQGVAGFWYRPFVGPYGRYQIGLQYSYTERKAFSGNGALDIAPVANENMLFTSFRYYPF
jgi:hypothetical protein